MHLQYQKRSTISAPTALARATYQANAPVGQMPTGRSPDQLQGTYRITYLEIQVTQAIFNQNRGGHQQTMFNERFNRQYLPNYNSYQPSPLGSIPGQDLSATLIDLANIESRSLEIMVANQRSQ